MARQSVQRIADILVDDGLADVRDNPAHRRAKLLTPTKDGLAAVRRINPAHAQAAAALVATLGADRATEVVQALHDLSAALARPPPSRTTLGALPTRADASCSLPQLGDRFHTPVAAGAKTRRCESPHDVPGPIPHWHAPQAEFPFGTMSTTSKGAFEAARATVRQQDASQGVDSGGSQRQPPRPVAVRPGSRA